MIRLRFPMQTFRAEGRRVREEEGPVVEDTDVTMEELAKAYTVSGGSKVKPTRLTMDGCRVWQTTDKLNIRLVDIEDQQILAGQSMDAYLISGAIYGRNWFGSLYIRTQMVVHEDRPLVDHLAQMQWIPVELEDA